MQPPMIIPMISHSLKRTPCSSLRGGRGESPSMVRIGTLPTWFTHFSISRCNFLPFYYSLTEWSFPFAPLLRAQATPMLILVSFFIFYMIALHLYLIRPTPLTSAQMRMFHGVLMGTSWGISLTIGSFIARYERHTAWWQGAHRWALASLITDCVIIISKLPYHRIYRIMQFTSTVITFPALFVATKMVAKPGASVHAFLGYILSGWDDSQKESLLICTRIMTSHVNTYTSLSWLFYLGVQHFKAPSVLYFM